MTDNALTTHNGRSSWLALARTGQTIFDYVSSTLKTRLRFSSRCECLIEFMSKTSDSSATLRIELDANLILSHIVEHCKQIDFGRANYNDAANSLRSGVTSIGSNEYELLKSDQISQRLRSMSIEKYERERECIHLLLGNAKQLIFACDIALEVFDRKIKHSPRKR